MFRIIGVPAKRDPRTRQSADNSMVFILSRLFKNSIEKASVESVSKDSNKFGNILMLNPVDYSEIALNVKNLEKLWWKYNPSWGEKFDLKYPEGIPSQFNIELTHGKKLTSGFVIFPPGHSANTTHDLKGSLEYSIKVDYT